MEQPYMGHGLMTRLNAWASRYEQGNWRWKVSKWTLITLLILQPVKWKYLPYVIYRLRQV